MKFLLATGSLLRREVVRFLRQKNRVMGALGTPVVFWLILGFGLGRSFHLTTAGSEVGEVFSYGLYFFPGTLVMILLFTAIFSTISIIEDRREGFLQGVLVAPVSRGAIVLGKILGGTLLAWGQGFLFLLAAPFLGITLSGAEVFKLSLIMGILAFGLTGLGFLLAWRMESTQGFHAIMNLFLMPLWILSGALFPAGGAPAWMAWVMRVNPLSYGVAALQSIFFPEGLGFSASLPSFSLCLVVTLFFSGLMFLGSLGLVKRFPQGV